MFEAPENKNAATNKPQDAAAQTQQQAPDANKSQGKGVTSLLSALGSSRVSPIADGVLSEFLEKIKEISKTDVGPDAIKFHHNSSVDLRLPLLAFSRRSADMVYFYAILPEVLLRSPMEAHEEILRNNFGQAGKKIEIDFPVSKCWNQTYISTVQELLAAEYKVEPNKVRPVHFWAIGKNTSLVENGMPEKVYNTASLALKSKVNPGTQISAALFKENDLNIDVETDIIPGNNVIMSNGLATAADALVTVRATERNHDKSNPHSGGDSVLLSRTAVKFDTIRNPGQAPAMQPGQMGMHGPQPQNHAILVATGIDAYDNTGRIVVENPMTPMLGVLSLGLLASGTNYESIFQPAAKKGPIPRDLSVLGYEYEPFAAAGARFVPAKKDIEYGISASKEGAITFRSFMDSYFVRNSMTLAIDVGIGTRESWTMQLFVAAAKRIPGANEALYRMLDGLTENNFSKAMAELSQDKEIVQSAITIIHGGQYDLADGSPSDIRWIDTLAAIAAAKEEAAAPNSPVRGFSESFIPGATDGAQGLERLDARRKDIIALEPFTEGKFDTLYVRVFFNPDFARAAARAMAAAGINMNPRGLTDTTTNSQLAAGFRYGQSVDASNISAIFCNSTGPMGSNYGNHMPGSIYI